MKAIFAAKEREKVLEQRRLSRKAGRIVVGAVLALLLVFVCFPDKKRPVADTTPATPVSDAHKGDIKFAMELIQYVQPEDPRTAPETPEQE